MSIKIILALIIFMLCFDIKADAFLINEVLADPAAGLAGDANNDGISSSVDDEFLEFYNPGTESIDLSGWYLNDVLRTRHVFPSDTLLPPQGLLVVFGGGTASLPKGQWQMASTGTLSLNNTAEIIFLFDNMNRLIEQVSYGIEAGADQSIVRFPEGTGETFVKHSTLPKANMALFSPGYLVDPPDRNAVVPELPTIVYLCSMFCFLPFCRMARL